MASFFLSIAFPLMRNILNLINISENYSQKNGTKFM
jgi:hypothetical protein